MLRVLYVCRGVDDDDPFTGVQAAWIRALAAQPDVASVHVLARHVGDVALPDNVTVRTFGRGRGARLRFLREVARSRPWPDVFLVTQGGPWPLLLLPFKLLGRRRVFQWLAQPVLSWQTRAAIAIADTGVFTATAGSLPRGVRRVHVVGHGIDVTRFHPTNDPASRHDMVVVGRISPAKRIDEMVEALAIASKEHGVTSNLDIIGVSGRVNRAYKAELDTTIARLGLQDRVRFLGAVPYDEMPGVVAGYALALNFSTTALDKAVVEAMASGVPVLATNPCVREILPPDLCDRLIVAPGDRVAQAKAMGELLALSSEARAALAEELRAIVVDGHSITHLFDAIIRVMAGRG